jgi:hypothetical protein
VTELSPGDSRAGTGRGSWAVRVREAGDQRMGARRLAPV